MELIIKISDELFNIFKKHGIDAFNYFNEYDKDQIAIAIAHSIHYNPTGDCISREALKEKIDKKALDLANGGMIFVKSINHIIDNAPPVPLPDFKAGYKQAILDGKTNFSRPQGEWIFKTKSTFPQYQPDEFECSSCKQVSTQKYNFCPYCGADMRGCKG